MTNRRNFIQRTFAGALGVWAMAYSPVALLAGEDLNPNWGTPYPQAQIDYLYEVPEDGIYLLRTECVAPSFTKCSVMVNGCVASSRSLIDGHRMDPAVRFVNREFQKYLVAGSLVWVLAEHEGSAGVQAVSFPFRIELVSRPWKGPLPAGGVPDGI